MTNKYILVLLLSSLTFCLTAQENKTSVKFKFGKGLQITDGDSSAHLKFNFRFQSLYNSERTLAEGEEWENKFLIRRARLKFSGWVVNPNIKYKAELALSNRDLGSKHDFDETNEAPKIVLDAVVKWKAHKNLTIWAGQTKLPGNRERVVSSQKLQMVDRSLVNSIFNIDREMSLQLRGNTKIGSVIIKPIASFSLGEGRNITDKNIGGFHYISRLEVLPFGEFASKGDYFGADLKREKAPKLALGATYSMNKGAARQKQSGRFLVDVEGDYLEQDLQTIFADMMFKYQGLSVMAEYAHKIISDKEVRNDRDLRLSILDADGRSYYTGSGFNIQAGYLLKNNIEISGRYTSVLPDVAASFDGTKEYTLGLSKYVVGHALKVQGDVSLFTPDNSANNEVRWRLQMEFQL